MSIPPALPKKALEDPTGSVGMSGDCLAMSVVGREWEVRVEEEQRVSWNLTFLPVLPRFDFLLYVLR